MALSVRQDWARLRPAPTRRRSLSWVTHYQWSLAAVDAACGLLAGLVALISRFASASEHSLYLVATAGLPLVWIAWVGMAGGYDPRIIGLGSEEYRRVINAAISLTAAVAIVSYAFKVDFARGYVLIALPGLGAADTAARYVLRKRLHRQRRRGENMRRVTAVGHAGAVSELIAQLRRDRYHGLEVVGACLADHSDCTEVGGVPVTGGLDHVSRAVGETGSDTVAVLACPEMDGKALRRLAWELEKDRHRSVRGAGPDGRGRAADHDPAGGRAAAAARGPRRDRRGQAGDQERRSTRSWPPRRWPCFSPLLVGIAVAILVWRRRPGAVLARPDRQGRAAVHRAEVPHHVPDAELRREALAPWTRVTGCCSRCARIRG